MENYHHGAHAVFLVTYHIVFVTKYRRPCIDDEIGEYIKQDLARIIASNNGAAVAIEYDKDHVHILAELPMDKAITKMIAVLKGVTSRNVRRDYAEKLKKWLWGDSFWSDSYFIASTGGVTLDVVKKYVDSQRTEKRKRGRPAQRHSSPTDP